MVFDDEEIQESRRRESAQKAAAKEFAAEKRRTLKRFSAAALKTKKANDERAFAEQLRNLDVNENSPEWKKAWEYFYS